jgi:stress response protein YsnF
MTSNLNEPNPELTIPLVEETLEATVVPVERGKMRIHKRVVTEPVESTFALHQGEVTVERVARNEVVTDRLKPWHEDGALMIPVYEEVAVTEVRLVLREVVCVKHRDRIEHITLEGDVRREVVDVEEVHE